MASLLLTLNIFHDFLYSFYCDLDQVIVCWEQEKDLFETVTMT